MLILGIFPQKFTNFKRNMGRGWAAHKKCEVMCPVSAVSKLLCTPRACDGLSKCFVFNMRRILLTHMEVSINSVKMRHTHFHSVIRSFKRSFVHSSHTLRFIFSSFSEGWAYRRCFACVASAASYDFDVVPERPIKWTPKHFWRIHFFAIPHVRCLYIA